MWERAGRWPWRPKKTRTTAPRRLRTRRWRRWVHFRSVFPSVGKEFAVNLLLSTFACRGFETKACPAALCQSPVLRACRAAERRRARRVQTLCLCLHPWLFSSTASCSPSHRMTRWGGGGRCCGGGISTRISLKKLQKYSWKNQYSENLSDCKFSPKYCLYRRCSIFWTFVKVKKSQNL